MSFYVFVTLANSNAEFFLPFNCTFILFISYILLYKKPLQNSKQLPFYLLKIQQVRAQLGVSSAGPLWDHSAALAQWTSVTCLAQLHGADSWLDLSLHMVSYLQGAENLGLFTHSSVPRRWWWKLQSILRTKLRRPITSLHHSAGQSQALG